MIHKNFSTGEVYNQFDQIIKKIEQWIQVENLVVWSCHDNLIRSRIIQRVVELGSDAYTEYIAKNLDKSAVHLKSSVISIGGLRINLRTGEVRPETVTSFRHLAFFFVEWSHLLIFQIIGLLKRTPRNSMGSTLLMEAGDNFKESDERLTRFCRRGPIDPLRSAQRIIIRSRNAPEIATDPSFVYAKHPLLCLINTQLQWSHKAILLMQHLGAPIIFFQALINNPLNIIISRDFYCLPVIKWLDKNRLIEGIIITTSSFKSQSLWMNALVNRNFNLHMIWYSQNFIPKTYIGEDKTSSLPSARHINVDVHWVWTQGFKDYLKLLGQKSDIRVVGPIIWCLPDATKRIDKNKLKIALFDVTPLPDGARPFGALSNYYTPSLMKKFIQDVVDVCKEIEEELGKEVLIILKHKREIKIGRHDAGYFKFISQLRLSNKKLYVVNNEVNLFSLLGECVASISVPYTSAAYISVALNQHGIYYDPFGELVPTFENNKYVYFLSSKNDLKVLLKKIILSR
jgi:hypothetical protein